MAGVQSGFVSPSGGLWCEFGRRTSTRHGARFQLNARNTHQPSSPAKAGDPVFQSTNDRSQRRSVLDTPLSRGMTPNVNPAQPDPRIIARRASARPISTKADVTSGPPTRMPVGVFILFHS